jgi:hypothetical protein
MLIGAKVTIGVNRKIRRAEKRKLGRHTKFDRAA